MKQKMMSRPRAQWRSAAKGLAATIALMLSIGNATATILALDTSALGSSFDGRQGFLTFDGTNFSASSSGSGYLLRFGVSSMLHQNFSLGDYNSNYSGDGFTPGALPSGGTIGDGVSFDGNFYEYDTGKFPAAPPGGSYYG